MKCLFGVALFLLISFALHAQYSIYSTSKTQSSKPPIDSSVYHIWAWVSDAKISNDGHFVSYIINDQCAECKATVLQATMNDWRQELSGVDNVAFTTDSKQVVFKKVHDTLCLLTLGTNNIINIPHVDNFKLVTSFKGEWLLYKKKESKFLVLRDLSNGEEKLWNDLISYWFSGNGKVLITQTQENKDGVNVYILRWNDLEKGISSPIYQGDITNSLYFDSEYSQIAFVVQNKGSDQTLNSIWYYEQKKAKSVILLDDKSNLIGNDVKVEGITSPGFSQDGTRLFFSLKESVVPRPQIERVQVNVWHYRDAKLQPQQANEGENADPFRNTSSSYLAAIRIDTKQVFRLANKGERVTISSGSDEFGIISNTKVNPNETWHTNSELSSLLSTIDGRRIFEIKRTFSSTGISPKGKFFVYFDAKKRGYFSYSLSTGKITALTNGLKVDWVNRENQNVLNRGYPIAGWLSNDSSVFVYDHYDIWQIDLSGNVQPFRITKGYGHKHGIVFRFSSNPFFRNVFDAGQTIILTAFNPLNKYNGFYSKKLGIKDNLDSLTLAPFLYDLGFEFIGSAPIKANNAEAWIVTRQSAYESPNYFFTTDFKSMKRLSVVGKEKEFNWFKSELHSWKASNGITIQGILYKPDNFDSTKLYPIIFHYYEKRSDRLNLFIRPEHSDGDLNIPWYVSNGYLVFEPDIHFRIGHPGESALVSLVSAANYLSKLPYINSRKMGIQGISFGGFLTNYIVTHTNIFACACTSAGAVDFVSYYGDIHDSRSDGSSQQIQFEKGQYRIGKTLWEAPNLYLENSPILKANHITTPMLIMHTSYDGAVPFSQAVALFSALRRLQKRAWLLEYEDGDHGIWGISANDFTIRMSQFFDHYLKERPAPVWMTVGISAATKGVDTGYSLDTARSCGNNCNVCKMWNRKLKDYRCDK